jgi:outer membrane protein OmpA-like peptidoglycan-associated protein
MRTRRAAVGSTIRGFAAFGVVAVAGSLATLEAAHAQARSPGAEFNEVPIGTFTVGPPADGFSIVEPPEGVPEARQDNADDGSGRWFFQGWERSPPSDTSETLYNDARNALESGRVQEAQSLFERLIADAPGSPRAAEARMQLGRIYRGDVGKGSQTETGALPAPAARNAASSWSSSPEGLRPAAAAADISAPLPRSLISRARVSAALDSEFLSDAGDRVFFSAGSANLGVRARGVIQSQARFLSRHPELTVAVEGHADDGALPDDESLRLSQDRAAAVRDRLVAEGVEAERIVAYGRGREERVSDCPAPECLAQNRRAVTVLLNGRVRFGERTLEQRSDGGAAPFDRDLAPQ